MMGVRPDPSHGDSGRSGLRPDYPRARTSRIRPFFLCSPRSARAWDLLEPRERLRIGRFRRRFSTSGVTGKMRRRSDPVRVAHGPASVHPVPIRTAETTRQVWPNQTTPGTGRSGPPANFASSTSPGQRRRGAKGLYLPKTARSGLSAARPRRTRQGSRRGATSVRTPAPDRTTPETWAAERRNRADPGRRATDDHGREQQPNPRKPGRVRPRPGQARRRTGPTATTA